METNYYLLLNKERSKENELFGNHDDCGYVPYGGKMFRKGDVSMHIPKLGTIEELEDRFKGHPYRGKDTRGNVVKCEGDAIQKNTHAKYKIYGTDQSYVQYVEDFTEEAHIKRMEHLSSQAEEDAKKFIDYIRSMVKEKEEDEND